MNENHHYIKLFFCNWDKEIWHSVTQSVFEFCCPITPLPAVMTQVYSMNALRKNVWAHGADLVNHVMQVLPQQEQVHQTIQPTSSPG
jgi:hypothetical protein